MPKRMPGTGELVPSVTTNNTLPLNEQSAHLAATMPSEDALKAAREFFDVLNCPTLENLPQVLRLAALILERERAARIVALEWAQDHITGPDWDADEIEAEIARLKAGKP